MAVNFYTDINAKSFVKAGGLSTQYLMADGSTTTSAGGSSPWTTDTNGITYTAGGVGIGRASEALFDLVVDGLSRFYNDVRVSANLDVDGDLNMLGGDIDLNGNNLLMNDGDIEMSSGNIYDNNDVAGTNSQILVSKGAGNGVRWQTITAGNLNAVTSVTTGEPSGSSTINNIVQISKTNYDAAETAGTLVTGTAYLIYAG